MEVNDEIEGFLLKKRDDFAEVFVECPDFVNVRVGA